MLSDGPQSVRKEKLQLGFEPGNSKTLTIANAPNTSAIGLVRYRQTTTRSLSKFIHRFRDVSAGQLVFETRSPAARALATSKYKLGLF